MYYLSWGLRSNKAIKLSLQSTERATENMKEKIEFFPYLMLLGQLHEERVRTFYSTSLSEIRSHTNHMHTSAKIAYV